jgi:hypothetical protein
MARRSWSFKDDRRELAKASKSLEENCSDHGPHARAHPQSSNSARRFIQICRQEEVVTRVVFST